MKTLIVRINVEDDSAPGFVGFVAGTLGELDIDYIGFEKPAPISNGPIHRGTGDLGRDAISAQVSRQI